MKKVTRRLFIAGAVLAVAYGIMNTIAKKRTELEDIDVDNPYVGGDKSCTGEKEEKAERDAYEKHIKPALDKALSFAGLVIGSPIFALIALAVYIDDPGPVLFTQKRIGKGKHYFMCHKFRSMKMSTPHDVPTHQLENPDQYITRTGRVLRRTSLDELPQIWDIYRSKMSVIGPRPALWNQNDLVVERDKYGANDVMPGLTGLAQIRGRDELEIPDKARIDGEYVENLSFALDVKCFLGTVGSVLKHDGVVEGGTGAIRKIETPTADEAGFEDYGCFKQLT